MLGRRVLREAAAAQPGKGKWVKRMGAPPGDGEGAPPKPERWQQRRCRRHVRCRDVSETSRPILRTKFLVVSDERCDPQRRPAPSFAVLFGLWPGRVCFDAPTARREEPCALRCRSCAGLIEVRWHACTTGATLATRRLIWSGACNEAKKIAEGWALCSSVCKHVGQLVGAPPPAAVQMTRCE